MPWVWILWLPLLVACVDCVALVDSFIILIQGECLERFARLTLTWITVQVTAIKVNKHKYKPWTASLTVDHSTVIKPAQLKINRERQPSSCHHLGHQCLHWFSSTAAAIKKWCTLNNPMAVCSLCGHFWWGSSGWIDWKQPASKWDQILQCKQEIVCSVNLTLSRWKPSRPTMCAMLSTGFSISHYNLSLAPTARLAKEQDSNNELYDSSLAAASETLAAYVTAGPMSVSIAISNVKM